MKVKQFSKNRGTRLIIWCLAVLIGFSCMCFIGIAVAHMAVFSRADYHEYDTERFLLYQDIDNSEYPRKEIAILSGKHMLTAYLYGVDNTQGLIVISPGHRDPNDVKLYEITFLVDAGWMVLCYDYTGCFGSEGKNMIGYAQSVYDLDAVLNYVESTPLFEDMPVLLFGHSLGGYASAAVLQFDHNITAAIIASGFDYPEEQWRYSIKRFTRGFHILLSPFTRLFTTVKYGQDAYLSAIDGINAVSIPVLVISGTDDDYYGGESPIYRKREQVVNQNCIFMLMDKPGHNGHYDYFLKTDSIEYRTLVNSQDYKSTVDKTLYTKLDTELMEILNDFLNNSLGTISESSGNLIR